MNSFSQLAKDSLRFALGTIYKENKIYPILFGPWRGMKLRYFSTLQFHMILGLYDTQVTEKLAKVLRATGRAGGKSVYCDLGANVGMYSLWFSRMIPQGRVFAFEPMPETLRKLRDHIQINAIENVEVVPQACSNQVGSISFFVGNGSHEVSSLIENWAENGKQAAAAKIEVSTTTLDAFFSQPENGEGPDFIKMDIEGGGIYALKCCEKIIQNKRPLWMIESHTPEEDRAISDLILQHGYCAYRLNNGKWVEKTAEVHPHPEGIWGSLLLIPEEEFPLVKKVLP